MTEFYKNVWGGDFGGSDEELAALLFRAEIIVNNAVMMSGVTVETAPETLRKPLYSAVCAQADYISENGLVSDYFNIGDTKNVTIGSATYVVEIVGFSHDDKADGSGKAGLTFGLKDCLNTAYQVAPRTGSVD